MTTVNDILTAKEKEEVEDLKHKLLTAKTKFGVMHNRKKIDQIFDKAERRFQQQKESKFTIKQSGREVFS